MNANRIAELIRERNRYRAECYAERMLVRDYDQDDES